MTLMAPTNLAAKANSDTAATLSWDKSSTGNGYQISVFKDANHSVLLNTYVKMSNETSLELTGLTKGSTYYCGIRTAMIADGKTVYSGWTYLTYTHGGVAAGVKNFRVTASGRDFTFSWDAVPNASGYQLAQLASNYQTYGQDIYDYNAGTTSAVLADNTRYAAPTKRLPVKRSGRIGLTSHLNSAMKR